jgi:hypothetical protein
MQSLKFSITFLLFLMFVSCGSIKSSIKNVDNNVVKPALKDNHFIITEYSTDKKYGYNRDYPINLGFENEKTSQKNIAYYFDALLGKKGEKFTYEKLESCCPFPSTRNPMGAGTLDVYEITFEGNPKKTILYINIFERGKVLCPIGFSIKK